jgi:hypothetical protein
MNAVPIWETLDLAPSDFKTLFARSFEFEDIESPDYVSDEDIMEAFVEASISVINLNQFPLIEQRRSIFLYLVAHFLYLDLTMRLSSSMSSNGQSSYPVKFRTVGKVSEGYQVPDWALSSPFLSNLARTPYGEKYLTLISPAMQANIMFAEGTTTLY